ncbi:unnamed protein product [Mortierella alpina]
MASTKPSTYCEHCLSSGEKPTALGFFKFSKASTAHFGSVNDAWRRHITSSNPAAHKKELEDDWERSKPERRAYWNSLREEEQAAAEQRGYMRTVSTAVMKDKTRTVAVLGKKYQDLLQGELDGDSASSDSFNCSKDDDTLPAEVESADDIIVQTATKRRRGSGVTDDALKLFKDSPLFDFFAYIFNKAQDKKPNPLPGVPSAVESPNINRIGVYAYNELRKANITEQDLKNVYVALSCIVSTQIPDAGAVFGKGMLRKIKEEIVLESFEFSQLEEVLSPLREVYNKTFNAEYLMEEIMIRSADIVKRERDGEKAVEGMQEVEKKVLEIIRYFCMLIVFRQCDHKLSETTCVSFWNHVWVILFGNTDIFFDMGELASAATKTDMQAIETLFGDVSQTGGRKTDTLLLRINRSILGHLGSMETIVFIDAHGLTGQVHGMKKIEDVFGTRPLGTIALPTNKYELQDFLEGDSLLLLFRYRNHMCRFAKSVLAQKARERRSTQTPPPQPTPTFHTPTKKRAPLPKKHRHKK